MKNIVIADPDDPYIDRSPEAKLRPTTTGILHLEMRDMTNFAFYQWHHSGEDGQEMREFDSIDHFRHHVLRIVREAVRRPGMTHYDLEYEAEQLTDRGISLMSNFKLANIDLVNQTAVRSDLMETMKDRKKKASKLEALKKALTSSS